MLDNSWPDIYYTKIQDTSLCIMYDKNIRVKGKRIIETPKNVCIKLFTERMDKLLLLTRYNI